jgi:hypothetical protein
LEESKRKGISRNFDSKIRNVINVDLLWNPQGNRNRGRPKNSWKRSVIKEADRSWNELRFSVADRQKWKGLRQLTFLEGTMDYIIIIIINVYVDGHRAFTL